MADPTLKRVRVTIAYTASDGYSAEYDFRAGEGTRCLGAGMEPLPELAMLEPLEELARLTALFGFEDEALIAFNSARQRVAEWRAAREGGQQG